MTAVTTALETPFARQGDATAQSRILDPTVKVSYDILCFVAFKRISPLFVFSMGDLKQNVNSHLTHVSDI